MRIPKNGRYRKSVGAFGKIDAKTHKSCVDFSTATECYNFDTSSGALTAGYGITDDERVPLDATQFFTVRFKLDGGYKSYSIALIDGEITTSDGSTQWQGKTFNVIGVLPYRLNGEDVALISSDNHSLITWNGMGGVVEHDGAPNIVDMALHYERLFAILKSEPRVLRFSDDLDPTNWTESGTEGGFIEMPDSHGDMLRVISFAGYLYVFREYGISRVYACGSQDGFTAKNLFVPCGKIFGASVAECGDKIMFLASDGLYAFDGSTCACFSKKLPEIVGASASAYFDGNYYLSGKIKFSDGEDFGLIVVDLQDGGVSISRGFDIEFMSVCDFEGVGALVARTENGMGVIRKCGKAFGASLHKKWVGGSYSERGDKIKTVQDVYINSSCDCALTVNAAVTNSRRVTSGERRAVFNAYGKSFSLTIETDENDPVIEPPTVIYIE